MRLKYLVFVAGLPTLLVFSSSVQAWNVPAASGPKKEACINAQGGAVACGDTFSAILNGVKCLYTCNCNGNDIPVSSGTGGGIGIPSGSKAQNFRMQMTEILVRDAFAAIMSSSSDNTAQEQQKALDEQNKKAALFRWQQEQNAAELKRQGEKAVMANQGSDLLSRMQPVGGNGVGQSYAAGNPKVDIKPMSQNSYPTGQFSDLSRLMCSAYFSNLAHSTTNDVEARFYGDQVQKVMAGQPTNIECRMPHDEKTTAKIDAVNKLYDGMREKINDLRIIDSQIAVSKDKQNRAEAKKEDALAKLRELETHDVASATPEQKSKDIDLEKLAREQLETANQESDQAKQDEEAGQNKKDQEEKEYNNLQAQMKSTIQSSN